MCKTPLTTAALALLFGLAQSAPAAAQSGAPPARQAEAGISLDAAVAAVRARTEARILAAETRQAGGQPVHLIRILTRKGKVRRIRIDAASGRAVSGR